jgi:hypothetical protein
VSTQSEAQLENNLIQQLAGFEYVCSLRTDFLSSLDKKIAGVKAQIEKNKQFKKGLLQEMFV